MVACPRSVADMTEISRIARSQGRDGHWDGVSVCACWAPPAACVPPRPLGTRHDSTLSVLDSLHSHCHRFMYVSSHHPPTSPVTNLQCLQVLIH